METAIVLEPVSHPTHPFSCPADRITCEKRDPAKLKDVFDPELNALDQEDPKLIEFIREERDQLRAGVSVFFVQRKC